LFNSWLRDISDVSTPPIWSLIRWLYCDRFAGEILVVGHLREDGRDAFDQTAGHLVDLLILELVGLLGRAGHGAVGSDLLGDRLCELVHPLLIQLLNLLVRHEYVGGALGNGVLEKLVHRLDMPACLLRGGLEFGVGLVAKRGQLSLLSGAKIGNGPLMVPYEDTDDDDGGEYRRGKLFFKLLPHVCEWLSRVRHANQFLVQLQRRDFPARTRPFDAL
jgi:hypothetical protein